MKRLIYQAENENNNLDDEFTNRGFVKADTGGNCTAWLFNKAEGPLSKNDFVYVVGDSNIDRPESPDEKISVEFQDEEGFPHSDETFANTTAFFNFWDKLETWSEEQFHDYAYVS